MHSSRSLGTVLSILVAGWWLPTGTGDLRSPPYSQFSLTNIWGLEHSPMGSM